MPKQSFFIPKCWQFKLSITFLRIYTHLSTAGKYNEFLIYSVLHTYLSLFLKLRQRIMMKFTAKAKNIRKKRSFQIKMEIEELEHVTNKTEANGSKQLCTDLTSIDSSQQDASLWINVETESATGTQFLAAAVASLTGVMMGQMLSWSAPVTPLLIKAGTIDKDQESWLVSILNFGAVIGCTCAGTINNYFGRKTVLLTACVPQMASWLLLAFCSDITLLCLARFLGGLCVGFFCVTSPLYISEIAQASIRGALGALFQLSVTIGILTTFTLGLLNNAVHITLAESVVVLIFGCLFLMMPESPIFLLMAGRPKEASESLQWFRGPNYKIQAEICLIEAMVQETRDNKASYSEFVTDRGSCVALVIALGLFFFQQFSGINAVVFYMNTVFTDAGESFSPTVATIIIALLQVLGTALSVYLMEKAGRRFLFISSFAACTLCVFVLGLYFYLKEHGFNVSAIEWLPLASVAVFLVVYALGAGPVPWAMVGELFNKNISSLAMSVVTGVGHWASAFLVTKAFATCALYVGMGGTFFMFVGFCVVGVLFSWILLPETKGRPLQDILDELSGKWKK